MSDISTQLFNFYRNYIWQPTDFANFQTNVFANAGNLGSAFGPQSILHGFGLSSFSGLSFSAASGVVISNNGQISVVPAVTSLTLASPTGGHSAWSLAVVRPSQVDANFITDPNNPLGPQIPLNENLVGTPLIINGVPAASPAYPSVGAQDVVLMGFKMQSGTSGFSQIVLDPSVRNAPGRLPIPMVAASGSYTVLSSDRYVEVDASAGAATLTLPSVSSVVGHLLKLLKSDSSANAVTITPNGSDTINGSSAGLKLYNKNSSISLISNANEWKIVDGVGGTQISSSCGNFISTTAAPSFQAVTNLSVNLLTTGKSVFVGLIPDGNSSSQSYVGLFNNSPGSELTGNVQLLNGSNVIGLTLLTIQSVSNNFENYNVPPGTVYMVDQPAAGLQTYTVKCNIAVGSEILFQNVKLVAFELAG